MRRPAHLVSMKYANEMQFSMKMASTLFQHASTGAFTDVMPGPHALPAHTEQTDCYGYCLKMSVLWCCQILAERSS